MRHGLCGSVISTQVMSHIFFCIVSVLLTSVVLWSGSLSPVSISFSQSPRQIYISYIIWIEKYCQVTLPRFHILPLSITVFFIAFIDFMYSILLLYSHDYPFHHIFSVAQIVMKIFLHNLLPAYNTYTRRKTMPEFFPEEKEVSPALLLSVLSGNSANRKYPASRLLQRHPPLLRCHPWRTLWPVEAYLWQTHLWTGFVSGIHSSAVSGFHAWHIIATISFLLISSQIITKPNFHVFLLFL